MPIPEVESAIRRCRIDSMAGTLIALLIIAAIAGLVWLSLGIEGRP